LGIVEDTGNRGPVKEGRFGARYGVTKFKPLMRIVKRLEARFAIVRRHTA
jgi:ribosomal protein L37AE/L43A